MACGSRVHASRKTFSEAFKLLEITWIVYPAVDAMPTRSASDTSSSRDRTCITAPAIAPMPQCWGRFCQLTDALADPERLSVA
jgi:hypothetical protein